MNTPRLTFLASLALAASLAHASPSFAQLSLGGGGGGDKGGASSDDDKKKAGPPPAIPGAVANEPVVPATKSATDMDPNAALFDAIDRGDITAARDALARGADLNARNVLGQRPIDLSVDLSRNDITFLLLSMRAQNGDQAPAADNGDQTAQATPASDDAEADATPATHRRHGRGSATAPAGGHSGAEFASTQHAGSGAPQPDSGFLGFGSR